MIIIPKFLGIVGACPDPGYTLTVSTSDPCPFGAISSMSSPDSSPSVLGLLLNKHRAGDPVAVNEIIVHCEHRFRHFAHLTRGRVNVPPPGPDTDDVLNDCVVRLIAVLRGETFNDSTHFLSYAARIMRNHLLDLAKKHRPELVPQAESNRTAPNPLRDAADSTNDPELLARWSEIHAIIALLPDEERVLFDLIVYQDLTLTETSALLSIPLTTLRTKWQNARLHFMRMYGNDTPF